MANKKSIRKKIFEDNVTIIKIKVYKKMSKSQAPSPNSNYRLKKLLDMKDFFYKIKY
ncbi:MAG: hypothetical protein ABIN05_02300 [candidate division WOR-3 bacterium]